MTRPAGEPIGPSEDVALGSGVLDTIEKHIKVMGLRETPRCKRLLQCASFYQGTHHDHLGRRWDGAARDPGVGYLHERLAPQGFVPVQSIPYGARKPDTSMPLTRQIVSRFSEMLLGEGRQPSIYVPADLKTERFLSAFFDEAVLWDVLMEARDVAGAAGSCAIVPSVVDGVPTAEVLMPYDIHVMRWKNGANWEPLEVVEQRLVDRVVPDEDTGKLEVHKFWRTRLWTETHVVAFDDVPEDWEDEIPVAKDGKVEHKAGRCPVVWYQNTRNTKSPDGAPDCDGVWHLLDQLDRLSSQVNKAARANVDPTLHIKEEERIRRRMGTIRKGAGGVVATSASGDAKYLEIAGTSVTVGMELMKAVKEEILQTAECVIVDPNNAGAYKTGEALQMLWRAMEAKANRLRVPVKQVLRELSRIALAMGRAFGIANIEDDKPGEGILLPPVVKRPDKPEDPDETERNDAEVAAQEIGTGAHVEFRWPPYWAPTPLQVGEMAQALIAAKTGGVLSDETRIGRMSNLLGIDPQEEQARIAREEIDTERKEEEAFEKELDHELERQRVLPGPEPAPGGGGPAKAPAAKKPASKPKAAPKKPAAKGKGPSKKPAAKPTKAGASGAKTGQGTAEGS